MRRRARDRLLLIGSLLLLVVGTAVLIWAPWRAPDGPRDMAGNPVDISRSDLPSDEQVARMDVRDDLGARFSIPAVGLDVPLGELSEVDGEITPPGFASAYLVRNRGVALDAASSGAVYVVMHAIQAGTAPGNYLATADGSQSAVPAGTEITLDDHRYRVSRSFTTAKQALPYDAAVWSPGPGQLIIITCIERTGHRSTDNLVITATLEV